ncbi:MAG TPA: lipoprotein [Stellaceae bacterium]|jgi:ABC-type uncharacterized transport system auxiliary subunit|nr:lipoprotein [Stellaceae bacterium]
MSRTAALAPVFAHRHGAASARIVVVLLVALMLAGCGKKGAPQPPADEPNTYPRQYPSF